MICLLLLFAGRVKSQNGSFLSGCSMTKIALIIGQADYRYYDTLDVAIADVTAMENTLKALGFTIVKCVNIPGSALRYSIDQWYDSIQKFDLALFYFSGHGVEAGGEDFMVPTDAKLFDSSDVRTQCYSLKTLVQRLEACSSKANIILFDACRSDISGAKAPRVCYPGLRKTCMSFASEPGEYVIHYRFSPLSMYTLSLIQYLERSSNLFDLFAHVREDVKLFTRSRQSPIHDNDCYLDAWLATLVD